jgi:hypothetical protein
MIKVDRQLISFHLHFLKPWWVLMLQLIKVDRQLHFATMSIELASVCITHWIKKFLCFRVSIYLEHLQNVYC